MRKKLPCLYPELEVPQSMKRLSLALWIVMGVCASFFLGRSVGRKELSTRTRALEGARGAETDANRPCVQVHTWKSDDGNPTTVVTIPDDSKAGDR